MTGLHQKIVRFRESVLVVCMLGFFQLNGQDVLLQRMSFNSIHSDFAAAPFRKGIVFCSNRTKRLVTGDVDSLKVYYTDLFYTFPGKNGKWRNPVLLSRELTGILNEGPSAFGNSDSVIYYTGNMNPPQDKWMEISKYRMPHLSHLALLPTMESGLQVTKNLF